MLVPGRSLSAPMSNVADCVGTQVDTVYRAQDAEVWRDHFQDALGVRPEQGPAATLFSPG